MRKFFSYLGAVLLYASLLVLGLLSTVESVQASLFWPSSGLLLALLWLSPYRYWPLLLIHALFLESALRGILLEQELNSWRASSSLLANAAESTIGALVLRRWPGRKVRIASLGGLLRILLAGCLLGSTIGTTLALLRDIGTEAFFLSWRIRWLAHAIGIVTVSPTLLWTWQSWKKHSRPLGALRSLELSLTLFFSLALVLYVFSRPEGLAQPFILYPPLIWIAGRFGLLPIAFTCLATSGIAITYTRIGLGPFNLLGTEARADSAAQMFVLALTLSALAIATNLSDRARSMSQKQRAQAELRKAEQQYETLFEQAAAAILVASPQKIERANPAALKLLGRNEEEILVPLQSLSLPGAKGNETFLELWPDCARDGLMVPWTALRGDGQTLDLELYISTTDLDSGPKYQVVLRDKTRQFELRRMLEAERQRLEEAVVAATAELEKTYQEFAVANEHRERFLATVSHELRTPLSGILGLCETMKEELWGPLAPDQKRALERISESGQYLDELVNDLLEMAKVQGDMELELEPHQVSHICHSSLRLVSAQAAARKIEIVLSEPTEEEVVVDGRFCKQILVNLLTNSIKFTAPGGKILVQALLDGTRLSLRVSDNGPGIPESLRERIFEPFARADESVPGSGLGLPLVYKLTLAMGGQVHFTSDPERGTDFTVDIPVGGPGISKSDKPREVSPRRILLLSKKHDGFQSLARYLRVRGYLVKVGLEDFWESKLAELEPDLVVLESLGDLESTLSLTKSLHSSRSTGDSLPIIVLVPSLQEEIRRALIAAGASSVLPKLTPLPDIERISLAYL